MNWPASFLSRILPKSRFVRNVATLAGGTLAAQVIMAAAAPIATRLYSPADYGVLTVYAALSSIPLIVAAGRYELSITVAKDDESALNVLALSSGIVCALALLSAAIIWFFGDGIAAAVNLPGRSLYLWFLPFTILCGGMYQVLNYWSVRTSKFREIAKTKLTQSIGSNATVIGLGFAHTGPVGLLLGLYVTYSAGAVALAKPLWCEYRHLLCSISWKQIRDMAKRYRRFPLMSAPAALLNNGAFFLPPMLVSAFFGTQVAGLFGLAMRIVGIPCQLIGTAMYQVFLGETAQAAMQDRAAIYRIFNSVTKKTMKLGLLVIGFGCLSPYVFGIIFGQRWQTAGLYCALLSVLAAAEFVVAPISTVTTVVERQDLQLVSDLVRCILVVLAFLIPYKLGLSATVAIGAYALTMLITHTGNYFLYRWIALNCAEQVEETVSV